MARTLFKVNHRLKNVPPAASGRPPYLSLIPPQLNGWFGVLVTYPTTTKWMVWRTLQARGSGKGVGAGGMETEKRGTGTNSRKGSFN